MSEPGGIESGESFLHIDKIFGKEQRTEIARQIGEVVVGLERPPLLVDAATIIEDRFQNPPDEQEPFKHPDADESKDLFSPSLYFAYRRKNPSDPDIMVGVRPDGIINKVDLIQKARHETVETQSVVSFFALDGNKEWLFNVYKHNEHPKYGVGFLHTRTAGKTQTSIQGYFNNGENLHFLSRTDDPLIITPYGKQYYGISRAVKELPSIEKTLSTDFAFKMIRKLEL